MYTKIEVHLVTYSCLTRWMSTYLLSLPITPPNHPNTPPIIRTKYSILPWLTDIQTQQFQWMVMKCYNTRTGMFRGMCDLIWVGMLTGPVTKVTCCPLGSVILLTEEHCQFAVYNLWDPPFSLSVLEYCFVTSLPLHQNCCLISSPGHKGRMQW